MKTGRPSKFNPEMCRQAERLCKLGATDKELADFFKISESTLNKWKLDFPEFSEALKAGKEEADAKVAASLYHRAIGYEHPDVHVSNYQGAITLTPLTKHYPPDPTSCIFWLKNRLPDLWRDRVEHTGKDGADLIPKVDPLEVARSIGYLLSHATQGA